MAKLHFTTIRWKNFLSTGNAFTELRLDKSPNTLVVGNNGAGKSTFIDAICFCLYGRPFRKIKKDKLINSINRGDLSTEIEFDDGYNEYKVVRGVKPAVFEIYKNGILENQDAAVRDYQAYLENEVLRMNFKSFTQVVVLGSASFVPFMQLPAGIRREVIEDFLDIRIFSKMLLLLKDRILSNREQVINLNADIKAAQKLIQVYQEQLAHTTAWHEEAKQGHDEEIVQHVNKIGELKAAAAAAKMAWDAVKATIEKLAPNEMELAKITALLSKLDKRKVKLKKDIAFYEKSKECPTCAQEIAAAFRQKQVAIKNTTHAEVELAITQLHEFHVNVLQSVTDLEDARKQAEQAERTYNTTSSELLSKEAVLNSLKRQAEKVAEADNTSAIQAKLDEVESHVFLLQNTYAEVLKDKETLDMAAVVLRDDGIKARIVKQYIPVINQLINKYLAALDFFVNFELDENFEETIRSRYRDDFSYENFSEGEKMRIDLSLLFTWRTVARLKNSANANLLVLDEVFDSSLDAAGCEEFLKLIHDLEGCNVFVVTHKGDLLMDKFKDVIKFEKNKNFSQLIA